MNNQFTKKEAPIQGFAGMGGGAFSRLLTSAASGGNRSLRFNPADSPTLAKTFAQAGDRRTWTFSCWVKRTTSFNTYRHTLASGPGTTLSFSETAQGGPDEWFFYVDGTPYLLSNAKLRDTSAWYHAVFVFDTTNSTQADRCRVYQNGERVTSWRNTAYPSQNFEGNFNTAGTIKVGCGNANEFLDGYMTDVYFIDGQALDPTSFGAADSNGVWQRSTYSGSYGTNGFHILDFANDATIGNDTSGNENHFTASNFSEVAGSGNDVLFDFPTNDTENTDSGAGGQVLGSYATLNSLQKGSNVTLSNGNLVYTSNANATHANKLTFSTIGVSSGKWYAEATCTAKNDNFYVGVMGNVSENFSTPYTTSLGFYATGWGYWSDGDIYNNGSVIDSAPASVGVNDVVGVALDVDNRTVTFYKNGVQQGSTATSLTADATWMFAVGAYKNSTITWNFGQRPFEYAAPTNHKCLTTTSLPTPAIADGSDYFDIDLYTGTGSTHERSEFSFSPDLVWIKQRNTTRNNLLFDIVRGANKFAVSNSSGTPGTGSGMVTSFDSDGFTVGNSADVNQSSGTFVAWCWDAGTSTVSNTDGTITSSVRANQTAGFSIATFTTPSSGTFSFGHGLSAAPELIIAKATNQSYSWVVYAKPVGNDKYLVLNTTAAEATGAIWNNTTPTSSVVSGNSSNFGTSTDYVAYCISPVASYSAVGSYVGNGSADGPFVHCGFKPAFIMIKGASSGGSNYNWAIVDTERSYANVANHTLAANLGNGESYFGDGSSVFGANNKIDILSNGFKPRESATFHNTSGVTYLYFAFAENPFQANGGLAR